MPQSPQPQPTSIADFFAANGITPQSLGATAAQGQPGSLTLEDLLKTTMYGLSGRTGLTDQPLVGYMPAWVRTNPQIFSAVKAGAVDPYLPTTDMGTWRVYVGPGTRGRRKDIPEKFGEAMDVAGVPRAKPRSGDDTESVQAVANQPFLWSDEQIKGAIKKFNDAGYTNVNDLDSLQKAWSGLAAQAGARYSLSSGKIKVTPWDMLELNKSAMSASGGANGGSPTRVTQTSRSVATITHGDGWSALQNTLSRMLGRDPTDEETRDFVGRMNYLAAKNPTITTSTTSGIGSAHQSTSSHTKSGFNSNDVLENAYSDAQANKDYAEYQSATTYYNAALSALGAIGG